MRVLALDPGERRIGVALSDPTGTLAQPLEVIERRGAGSRHLDRIADLVKEHEVERIVVGLPLHMDGRAGAEAENARRLGEAVAARTGLPIDFVDERWTTREAERTLRALGERGRRVRERADAVAAALVLRTWLDRRRA
jgi:putative Holliday junction resolvase